ncbi:MAG: hypothetical protein Q8O72_02380 [Bacteroidales bacterium]|jgi:Flp pilus assembly protein TadB|nr:hypothetical protein [Bacteroidales bacterium]
MKNSHIHRLLFVLLLISTMAINQGCIFGRKSGSASREAEKVEKQMQKENKAEFDKAYKQHMESQSDLTRKQMKAMKKQQKRANRVRKRTLWDRLFRNKCP